MRSKVEWIRAIETAAPCAIVVFGAAALTSSVRLGVLLLVSAAVAGTLTVAVAATTGSAQMTWVTALSGVASLGWISYTHTHSPWTSTALTAFALGAFVLTTYGAIQYARHKAQVERELAAADRARNAAELRKWTDLLEGVGVKGVYAVKVVTTRAGYVVTYQLPKDGSVRMGALVDAAERIDIAGAPDGTKLQAGSTRFVKGDHAGRVVMHMRVRDVLADEIPYPDDLSPLTINEPFDIGWSEDGKLCLIHFREIRLLIIGETGAGKTNLLNVIIAQLSRCVDVIIFGIDLKGGRLLAPWLKPWINKQTNRPVIDWPATDRAEAQRLLQALIRVIEARSRGFAGKNAKIKPSNKQQTYVVVCDEIAELFTTDEPRAYREEFMPDQPSPNSLAWLATRVTNKGRSEAVDAIWAGQRATASHVPSNIKSQCKLRIGLGTTTVSEATNLAPDDATATKIMALLQHPGTGVVWRKEKRPTADKFYKLEDPERIAQIAAHVGEFIRPEPNDFDRAALGEDYASRWQRLAPLLQEWSDMAPTPAGQVGGGAFEQIVAQLPDMTAGLKPWQMRTLEIVGEARSVGIRPGMIADKLKREGMGVERETVSRWLRTQANEGFVESLSHGRWRIVRLDRRTGTDG